MVKFLKFLAYTLFFFFVFLAFFPKENFFYLMEKEAGNYSVVISNETLHPKLFGFELEAASLSYEGIEVATIKKADLLFLLVYNHIDLQDIELSSLVQGYMPQKIASCQLSYSLLHPLTPRAVMHGSFGELYAVYDLQKSSLHLLLKPSKLMFKEHRNSLRYFKKLQNGEYSYEKSL